MADLINNLYLPDFNKRQVRDGEAYKLLEKNKIDTSSLEGYDTTEKVEPIEFPVFNSQSDKDKFVDENATSAVSGAKEYLETFGNFLTDETEDQITNVQRAAVNGADIAVNLMPLAYKMFEQAPIAVGLPKEFFNRETEEDVMRVAKHYSENLGEYKKHLDEKQKDNGWVKQMLSYVVQDSVYSIPAYNFMRKTGIGKYPAFILSAAVGAVGVENEDKDGDKTYFAPFSKDVQELKNLLNILPDTPADMIADEVHQALEYGMFGGIIPGVIDGLKFMKQYLPKFSTVAGSTAVVAGLSADNEAEGFVKPIIKALDNIPMFKSAVVDATDKIPAVASGDQIFNTIKNTTGVKANELKWMDLETFLKGKTKVSKEEVLEYINTNKLDVTEVKLSNKGKAGLSSELDQIVDDYETRWRDSDLADGVSPNYDKYNINFTNYGSKVTSLDRVVIDDAVNIPQDYNLLTSNPLIEGMDDFVEFRGTGTKWNTVEKLLEQSEWLDKTTGKYTGHLIEVPKDKYNLDAPAWTNDLTFVRANGNKSVQFVVQTEKLNSLPNEYTVLTKYEMDPLELERFHLEDEIRAFNKYRMDRGNNTLFEDQYTVKGGEDYTELVFKIKSKDKGIPAELEKEFGELAGNKMKSINKTTIDYRNPNHFNQASEFAHVRFKTRYLNDKKVLTVEEMQSDLLQASKKELFTSNKKPRVSYGDNIAYGEETLKDFPFKNTWYEFTIKRLARYASDNGFDAIAIPKGELAANRYGSKIEKLKRIDVEPFDVNIDYLKDKNLKGSFEPGFTVQFTNDQGKIFSSKRIYGLPGDDGFFENMSNVLEKEISGANYAEIQQMILDATDTSTATSKVLDKIEIAGTGKGKYHLYDRTIPGYMKKYAKKWNAKVFDDEVPIREFAYDDDIQSMVQLDSVPGSIPVTVLELSDEMKTGVTKSSQPLFELFGTVGLSTWGAKAVSDSMENNSISQTTN